MDGHRDPGLRREVQVRNEAGGVTCIKTELRHQVGGLGVGVSQPASGRAFWSTRVSWAGRGGSRRGDRRGKARQVGDTQGASRQGEKRERPPKGKEEPKPSLWVRNKERQASGRPVASSVATTGDTCRNGVPGLGAAPPRGWLRNCSGVKQSHQGLARCRARRMRARKRFGPRRETPGEDQMLKGRESSRRGGAHPGARG